MHGRRIKHGTQSEQMRTSKSEEDTITDKIKLRAIKTAKYLGQTINNQGEIVNIINTYKYCSITEIIKKVVNHISMRSKIKLFDVYIKSKFDHFIPMIALTGNLVHMEKY